MWVAHWRGGEAVQFPVTAGDKPQRGAGTSGVQYPDQQGLLGGPTCHIFAIHVVMRRGASFDLLEAVPVGVSFPPVPAPRWGLSPAVTGNWTASPPSSVALNERAVSLL